MKNGTLILVVAVLAVGGIWFYTRKRVAIVAPTSGSGGTPSWEQALLGLGTNVAGQGINAGLGALGNALNGSSSDGQDDGSGDSSGDDSGDGG